MARLEEIRSALRRYGLARDRLDSAVARRAGVSLTDFAALDHLDVGGPMTASELADRLVMTTGAVTGVIDRLERHGWVRRRPHPTDRRSILVDLTARARRTAADAYAGQVDELDRIARRFSAKEQEAIAAYLEALSELIAARGEDASRALPRK